jgi:hypothetical protein
MPSAFASSEFDDLFTEVSSDLGEPITLPLDYDLPEDYEVLTALVELDQLLVQTDRMVEQAGRIHVKAADAEKLHYGKALVYNGQTFHINGNGTPQHGMVMFEILRALTENTKTNLFDLQDRQATYRD